MDDKSEVTLITRPRRWGKTLNISMLQYFFAAKVYEQTTQGLFDGLKIAKEQGGTYLKYQGQYPVIFISFKDVKENSFVAAISKIKVLMKKLYREHKRDLVNSNELDQFDKELFNQYLNSDINEQELEQSISVLSELLFKHYNKKVYILIDEYDTPLNAAYKSHLDDMTRFMKNLLSAALKGNPYLQKGVMTGILRISKDSMLSGLNNVETHTLLNDKTYASYFGFTEDEVNTLFHQANRPLTHNEKAIKDWYNGYLVDNRVLYNPLSIIQCIKNEGVLAPYWLNTADDSLLKSALLAASDSAKEQFQQLISRQPIQVSISETIHFNDLTTNDTSLWSLLLAAGYLTCIRKKLFFTEYTCMLKIPNDEVWGLYIDIFSGWLKETLGSNNYHSFVQDLVAGNVNAFEHKLNNYLARHTSSYDFPRESNYHTFFLGLICSVADTHYLHSNPESGVGRPDVLLVPKDKSKELAIILEFKHVKKNQDQKIVAKQALAQIDVKHYQAFIEQYDYIKQVLKVGAAFEDKSVLTFHRIDDLENKPISDLAYSQSFLAS